VTQNVLEGPGLAQRGGQGLVLAPSFGHQAGAIKADRVGRVELPAAAFG
jgi:hypothetical protein